MEASSEKKVRACARMGQCLSRAGRHDAPGQSQRVCGASLPNPTRVD